MHALLEQDFVKIDQQSHGHIQQPHVAQELRLAHGMDDFDRFQFD
jgi:hypothetical protein